MDAASVQETMKSINDTCRAAGGAYAEYSCSVVSWDDVSRGTVGGSLSCWGSNITDTYLKSKDGQQLFTVRSDNWNEKLGRVSTGEVAVVASSGDGTGAVKPVLLSDFLKAIGARQHGGYAGLLEDLDLSSRSLDEQCSIRFQTTFIPVSGAQGSLEFATEAYNYNTHSGADPRNLVLLCTTQGVAVQQDGAGAKRLFHHAVDDDGVIHQYWLEAERSRHGVGGPQRESAAEAQEASSRGKATASVIGPRALGTRFNVLMTVQVPLKQQVPDTDRSDYLYANCANCCEMLEEDCDESLFAEAPVLRSASVASRSRMSVGVANAARVSRGSEEGTWEGLSVKNPERHPDEHVTITVVIYNTVAGGVPSVADVKAAIDDLERLYAACGAQGHLADTTFNFMKKALTPEDVADIATKLTTQPYMPPPTHVQNANVFPSCAGA